MKPALEISRCNYRIRSYAFRVVPKSNNWCPYKKALKERHTHRGHVASEAEIAVMWPQAKEVQNIQPASPVFRDNTALPTPWFQISSLQNSERINICCFRPPNLFTAALGNYKNHPGIITNWNCKQIIERNEVSIS